jgi:hypothetical protein
MSKDLNHIYTAGLNAYKMGTKIKNNPYPRPPMTPHEAWKGQHEERAATRRVKPDSSLLSYFLCP